MKKFTLFLALITCFISCEKYESNSTPKAAPALQPGELATTGILSYTCICVDGPGLIFGTDDHKTLVFDHYDSLVVDSIMTKYEEFMNVHSRLIYMNTGDNRCTGMKNQCVLVPIVKIASFTKL